MSEKQTQPVKTEGKTSGDKKDDNFLNAQNILAILLILSLVGNVYLFMQLSTCNAGGGGTTIPTITTTTLAVSGEAAKSGDLVKVDYIGKFENGTLFDTSIQSEALKAGITVQRTYEPLSVVIGSGQTIPGFENGLVGMKVGQTKVITVPPGEGYTTGLLGNKTLIFTVTMVAITPKNSIPVVSAIIINDKRCSDCVQYISQITPDLETIFPGLKITEYDYSSAEGKKIFTDLKLTKLPVVLFSNNAKDSAGYSQVSNYLDTVGQYYSLRVGAAFDPTAEICDNGVDDDGNGQVDCLDSNCKNQLICRNETKNNLQVFIMSDCPYGKLAVTALKEVVDNLGKELSFEVHYIANRNPDGSFSSLHGTYEADEDIIQLCVNKHSPTAWLSYINCRSLEGIKGKDWKNCANTSKVDIAAVQTCFSGTEGKALLAEDIKIAEALSIGASPTWLANNRYQFSGIDAQTVKTNICKYNANLTGCDKNLTAGSTASGQC